MDLLEFKHGRITSGIYRIQEVEPGVFEVIPMAPTDSWESGYDEGYKDGFEAGIQFTRTQPDD